ncbi:ribonuclease E inhibitor RraB [Flavobacterium acetivorans]|uniref:ribonuclease E inhibitor RraB n=1 Tax=Flavobacterium acetivorans TaxID=2893883 RepID=UPI001E35CDCB|nr:ribonuclease E inhibitor RraB [Flavobacterium sp. F-29]UFH34943.1 ribonuclease E inhibitor RraB [Flavobacterium sp. F-29]
MNWDTFYYLIFVPIIIINTIIYFAKNNKNPNKKNIVLKNYDFTQKSEEDKFVIESAFNKNLEKLMQITPQTIYHFRKINDAEEKELKLEFFFYTNKAKKAEKLVAELKKINYTVKQSVSEKDNKIFIITGWTTKIKMSDEIVKKWTNQMCILGYNFDCEFDFLETTK